MKNKVCTIHFCQPISDTRFVYQTYYKNESLARRAVYGYIQEDILNAKKVRDLDIGDFHVVGGTNPSFVLAVPEGPYHKIPFYNHYTITEEEIRIIE